VPEEDYAKFEGKDNFDWSQIPEEENEAMLQQLLDKFGIKRNGPTPGSTDSEPGDDAGPSTQDKKLPVNAQKSFTDWFSKI
jgi:hypothetical protein